MMRENQTEELPEETSAASAAAEQFEDDPVLRLGGGGGPGMGKVVLPLLLVAAAVAGVWWMARPSAALAWHQEVDAAVDAARAAGKPVLMYFTADWCPPCQSFKKNVLADGEVEKKLSGEFVLLKVDLTDRGGPNGLIARDYGVTGVPYFIVFDAQGQRVDAIAGAAPAGSFLAWLKQCQQRM